MNILSKWIKDSEKFEMQRSYHVLNQEEFNFLKRQDDFYISLLNRMFYILERTNGNYSDKAKELLELAKGLLIYSDKCTQDFFHHVDKRENLLYVASIYYLTGFEAIATLILQDYTTPYNNRYSRLIYYLVMGGKLEMESTADDELTDMITILNSFIESGDDECLEALHERIDFTCKNMIFNSVDEFFDGHIFKHILIKFRTDNMWLDLKKEDQEMNWHDYIKFSRKHGILQFLPSQRIAIHKGLLNFDRSFSLRMPTSAGKSFITELLIYHELKKHSDAKILYLCPLRSLGHELSERFKRVGQELGFISFVAYGGNSSTLDNQKFESAQLFITTPEFFSSMERGDDSLLDQFSLVICDEGQLLDSLKRGTQYELLLTRIKSRGIARFLFISAIIPNIKDVNTWLGGSEAEVGNSTYRPCEIKLAVGEKKKRDICLNIYSRDLNTVDYSIDPFLSKSENIGISIQKIVTVSCAMALKSVSAGSTLIFTSSKSSPKNGCVVVCQELLKLSEKQRYGEILIDKENRDAINKLHEYIAFQYGQQYPLSLFIKHGFAFHNGGIPQDIRELIEDYYREKWIKIIVSNTTLAEGVNLPIKTLVLYNPRRYSYSTGRQQTLGSAELRNIIGRVGRAGKEKYGLIMLPQMNKNVFRNVVEAIKGDGIQEIRGIFYDLIEWLASKTEIVTDESVNELLESIGASSAIDEMIYRHYEIGAENTIIENSISDSLAYHLSDNKSKDYIRRAFQVRLNRIHKSITDEVQLDLLKHSGLDLDDFLKMEGSINKHNLEQFSTLSVVDLKWLDRIIRTIYSMPSMDMETRRLSDNVQSFINSKNIAVLVSLWMRGEMYCHIADYCHLDEDEVMEILLHMEYQFNLRLKGLIQYLLIKYDFEDSTLSVLPDYIRFGVYKDIHIELMRNGLKNRIAVHQVSKIIEEKMLNSIHSEMTNNLGINYEMLERYIDETSIPQIAKDMVHRWVITNQ